VRRLRNDSGYTLIEVLAVALIISCLIAVAVPAYLSFAGTAQTARAKSNVRSAIPAAEQMSNTNGNYAGISGSALRSSAPGVGAAVKAVAVHSNLGYCIEDTEDGGATFYDYVGGSPGSALQTGFTAATVQPGSCLQAVGVTAG
jgi:prepilin-type N-terminal cleavage/methylation domain-containing protein